MADVVYGVTLDAQGVLKETKKVKVSEKELQDQLRKTNKGLEQQSKDLKNVGTSSKSLTKQIAGIAGAYIGLRAGFSIISSAVKTNIEFEQSLANVKAVMQPTAQEFSLMSQVIRNQAKVTVFSANEVSKGMEFLGKAGLDAVTSMKALPGVLELAAAGSLSMAEAANISTNIMSAMKLEAEDLARVNDELAFTASNSNTDVREMGEAFRIVAGVAESSGQSISNISEVLGGLAKRAISGADAGQKVKQMLARLIAPSSKAADTLERLKVQVNDASGKMRPLADILADLEKAGITSADAIAIFGKFTFSAALSAVGATKDIAEMRKGLESAEGAARKMAEIKLDTTAGQIKLMASAWEEVQLEIMGGTGALREIIKFFTFFIAEIPNGMQRIQLAFKVVIGYIIESFKTIKNGVDFMVTIFIEAWKAIANVAASVFDELGKSIGIALAGGFEEAFENLKDIPQKAAAEALKNFDKMKESGENVFKPMQRFTKIISNDWNSIGKSVNIADKALEALSKTSAKIAKTTEATKAVTKKRDFEENKSLQEKIKKAEILRKNALATEFAENKKRNKEIAAATEKFLVSEKDKSITIKTEELAELQLLEDNNMLTDEERILAKEQIEQDHQDRMKGIRVESLTETEKAVKKLGESFQNIAVSGLQSFISAGLSGANALKAGIDTVKNAVIDLAATLAAKAAVFGLLNLFTGGTGGTLLSFLGFKDGVIGFNSGVVGFSGAGTGKSDSNLARISNGESVMTAKATSMFAPILANMERSASGKVNYGGNAGSSYANGSIGVQTGFSNNGNINTLIAEVRSLKSQVMISGNATTKAVSNSNPLKDLKLAGDKELAIMVNNGTVKLDEIG